MEVCHYVLFSVLDIFQIIIPAAMNNQIIVDVVPKIGPVVKKRNPVSTSPITAPSITPVTEVMNIILIVTTTMNVKMNPVTPNISLLSCAIR